MSPTPFWLRPHLTVHNQTEASQEAEDLSYQTAFDLTREGDWTRLYSLVMQRQKRLQQYRVRLNLQGKENQFPLLDEEIHLSEMMALMLAVYASESKYMDSLRAELENTWRQRQTKYGNSIEKYERLCRQSSGKPALRLVTWGRSTG